MMDLLTSAMDAGAALAETFSKPVNTGASFTRYGTVVKNNGTTLDVELCGATLAAVPMLTTCAGANAGDRCLLTVDGPLVTVTGILANADNTHYVNIQSWSSGALYAQRIGNYCTCMISGSVRTPASWTEVAIGTLPEEYRPTHLFIAPFVVQNYGAACGVMNVGTNGNVIIQGKGGNGGWNTTDWVFGSVSYPVS